MLSRSPSSSPDPLSKSIDRLYPPSSPTKPWRRPTPKTLRTQSPNISRQSSPAKSRTSSPLKNSEVIPLERGQSVILTTPGKTGNRGVGSNNGPLKIRLTVETDPDDDSPSYDVLERTTTITVPLKGENEHKPVKRRIRQRKSASTPNAGLFSHVANGTPAERSQSRSRGRPKRNAKSPASDPFAPSPSHPAVSTTTTTTMATTAAAVNKRVTRMNFANLTPLHAKKNAPLVADEAKLQYTPWEVRQVKGTRAAQKIRDRVPTPRKPAGWDQTDMRMIDSSSPVKENRLSEVIAYEHETGDGVAIKMHTAEGDFLEFHDSNPVQEAELNIGSEDETTMLERSAVESEGFSMVSIDSLRNKQDLANLRQETAAAMRHDTHPTPARYDPTNHLHSPPTSSPTTRPLALEAGVTQVAAPTESLHIVALDGSFDRQISCQDSLVLTHNVGDESSSTRRTSPRRKRKSDEGVFDAFGTGTKRHLRAGLAMGELLARNQKGFAKEVALAHANTVLAAQEDEDNASPRLVGQPVRLPTPAASIDSVGPQTATPSIGIIEEQQSRTPPRQQPSRSYDFSSSPPQIPRQTDDDVPEATEFSRTHLLQQEFQREREEVLRQMEAANTSQVIILDLDMVDHIDESEEHTDPDEQSPNIHDHLHAQRDLTMDIWRDEADRSLEEDLLPQEVSEQRNSADVSRSPTPNFADLLVEDLRPPRAKLPRTWRRVSGKDFHYSDEVETPCQPVAHPNASLSATSRSPVTAHIPALDAESSMPPQASPPRASPPRCSPALEHTSTKPQHDLHYGSQGSTTDHNRAFGIGSNDKNVVDTTGLNECKGTNRNILNEHSELDTSDVRQLTRELKAAVATKPVTSFFTTKVVDDPKPKTKPSLLPQPGKQYAQLFEAAPPKLVKTQAAQPPVKTINPPVMPKIRVTKMPVPPPIKQSTNALPPSQEKEHEPVQLLLKRPASNVNLLSRVVSWVFPFSTATVKATASKPAPPATPSHPSPLARVWTRNHYLLLDHYHTTSLERSSTANNRPRRGPPLPATYSVPFDNIPSALTKYLNLPVATRPPSQHPTGTVSEHWIRVAHAFITVARDQGIPLLCDGSFEHSVPSHPTDSQSKHLKNKPEAKYPKRGPDGHVLRTQEEWAGNGGEWDVLTRVYSLWVRDELVYKIAEDDQGKGRVAATEKSNVVERNVEEEEVDEALLAVAKRRTKVWVNRAGK